MGLALEAGYDIGALAACFVALAGLVLAKELTDAVAAAFNISIFGKHPFGGVANFLHNSVVSALNRAEQSVEAAAARFESGLIDAFGLLIAIPLLLAVGIRDALSYLWNQALMPRIHSVTDDIAATAREAKSKASAAAGDAADALSQARSYARQQAQIVYGDATDYVDRQLRAAKSSLGSDIAAASGAVVSYVDASVAKLRAAEDAAVANAVDLAARAKVAGEAAGAAAAATASTALSEAETAALSAAAAGAAAAAAASVTALDGVRSVAVDVGNELHDLEQQIGAANVIGLVATIPLLATLVHAIADEAGLANPECRVKVKQVCQTDPAAWTDLLGGLAAIGFAFNLGELAKVANGLVGGLADVIREAA